MRCTKQDEIMLKQMQKMQMMEKKEIEEQERAVEAMWHQVLIDDFLRKTHIEKIMARKRQEEMVERRKVYDAQIASANQKRQQIIREEIERENTRLEKIKRKMEQDHYAELERKKQQQMTNKKNYLTSSDIKLSRIQSEKLSEKEFDNAVIRKALEELRQERQKKLREIQNKQIEKQICVENYKKEKEAALAMEQESDHIGRMWRQQEQSRIDECYQRVEREQRISRETAAKEYKDHVDKINNELIKAKQQRGETMERVKRTALKELRDNIRRADLELKKQIDYRNNLNKQIQDNQNHLIMEQKQIEMRDRPFTKKALMFQDAMYRKFKKAHDGMSSTTNPIHPFRRSMQSKQGNSIQLPHII
ncbi:trichohyalin isoform X2 [Manduca sexta]|uniref:trichohyalin isoform X2 n=1 Tax=Manduca sexta TaxID=7130 RepID=UPI001181CA77|nr:trichohyalin isoform X2 [Manduca sexta]